jgi:divalent metal cation (Fe/Co/Zn/Cd) transporter
MIIILKRIWCFFSKLVYPSDYFAIQFIAAVIFAVGFYIFLKGGIRFFDYVTIGILSMGAIALLIGIIKLIGIINRIKKEINNS